MNWTRWWRVLNILQFFRNLISEKNFMVERATCVWVSLRTENIRHKLMRIEELNTLLLQNTKSERNKEKEEEEKKRHWHSVRFKSQYFYIRVALINNLKLLGHLYCSCTVIFIMLVERNIVFPVTTLCFKEPTVLCIFLFSSNTCSLHEYSTKDGFLYKNYENTCSNISKKLIQKIAQLQIIFHFAWKYPC